MRSLVALLQFGMSAHPAERQTAGGAQTGAVEIRVGSTGQRRSVFALSPIDAFDLAVVAVFVPRWLG